LIALLCWLLHPLDFFEVLAEITSGDSSFPSRVGSVTVCKEEKVNAYVPDIQFRQRGPRFADQERFNDKKKADANVCISTWTA
jgi:hypothetical protein